jgi:hypothetical protein
MSKYDTTSVELPSPIVLPTFSPSRKVFIVFLTTDSVTKTYWHLALTDVQMLPEHCWNDTDRWKPQYSEKTPCMNFMQDKFQINW